MELMCHVMCVELSVLNSPAGSMHTQNPPQHATREHRHATSSGNGPRPVHILHQCCARGKKEVDTRPWRERLRSTGSAWRVRRLRRVAWRGEALYAEPAGEQAPGRDDHQRGGGLGDEDEAAKAEVEVVLKHERHDEREEHLAERGTQAEHLGRDEGQGGGSPRLARASRVLSPTELRGQRERCTVIICGDICTPISGGSVTAAGKDDETPAPISIAPLQTTVWLVDMRQTPERRHMPDCVKMTGHADSIEPEKMAHSTRPNDMVVQKLDVMMAMRSSPALTRSTP